MAETLSVGSDDFDSFMQSLAENYHQSEVVFSDGPFNENFLKDYNQAGSILPPDLSLDFPKTFSSESFHMFSDTSIHIPFSDTSLNQSEGHKPEFHETELKDHLQVQSKNLFSGLPTPTAPNFLMTTSPSFKSRQSQSLPQSQLHSQPQGPKRRPQASRQSQFEQPQDAHFDQQIEFVKHQQEQNKIPSDLSYHHFNSTSFPQSSSPPTFEYPSGLNNPPDASIPNMYRPEIKKEPPANVTGVSPTLEELLLTGQNFCPRTPSPQSSPPFFSASPHSPPDTSPLSGSSSPCSPEDNDPSREILDMISWKAETENRPVKRKRETDPAAIRQKHTEAEQKRRNEMNRAINDIARLLPSYSEQNDAKKTKLSVLAEASDYFKRVQRLCSQLLAENKSLKEEVVRLRSPSSSPKKPAMAAKIFAFFMLFLFTTFSPLSQVVFSSSHVSSRVILNSDTDSSSPVTAQQELLFALTILWTHLWSNSLYLVSVFFVLASFIYFLNFQMEVLFGQTESNLQQARQEIMHGFLQRDRGQLEKARRHFCEALNILNLGLPSSWSLTLLCTIWQSFRRISQTLYFGLWFERYILNCRPPQSHLFSEAAKAYSGILLPYSYFYTGELQYFYLALCAINAATVSGDPVSLANIYAEVSFRFSSHPYAISRLFSNYAREKAWYIVEQMKESNTSEIGKLFYAQGISYLQTCNFEEARTQLKKAINLYHKSDPRQERLAQMSLAVVHLFQGENEQALKIFLHSYKSACHDEDAQSTVWGLLGMGSSFIGLGEYNKAIVVLKRTVAEQTKFTMTEQILCKTLQAQAYFGLRDFERSLQLAHEALTDTKQPVDKKFFVLLAFEGLADCLLNLLELGQQSTHPHPLTSSIEVLSSLSKEACQTLQDLSTSTPLMKVISLRCNARYFSLEKQTQHASNLWVAALRTAQHDQWKFEEERIQHQMELYSDYGDDSQDELFTETVSV